MGIKTYNMGEIVKRSGCKRYVIHCKSCSPEAQGQHLVKHQSFNKPPDPDFCSGRCEQECVATGHMPPTVTLLGQHEEWSFPKLEQEARHSKILTYIQQASQRLNSKQVCLVLCKDTLSELPYPYFFFCSFFNFSLESLMLGCMTF